MASGLDMAGSERAEYCSESGVLGKEDCTGIIAADNLRRDAAVHPMRESIARGRVGMKGLAHMFGQLSTGVRYTHAAVEGLGNHRNIVNHKHIKTVHACTSINIRLPDQRSGRPRV